MWEKLLESQIMRPGEIIISFLKINSNLKNRGSVLIFAILWISYYPK